MMGDISAYQVRYAIEAWEDKGDLPPAEELTAALTSIDTALSWEARNGEYLEIKARLLYYQALNSIMQDPTSYPKTLFEEAVSLHRAALEVRPQWPYSWANLALMKAFANQYDDEFNLALYNANQYGPWEFPVQLTVTQAGVMNWDGLGLVQKAIVAANAQRGLVYQFKETAEILDTYQRRIDVCGFMARTGKYEELCGG